MNEKRLTSTEQSDILYWAAMISMLENGRMKNRITSMLPYGGRDYGLIRNRASQIFNGLMETIPVAQLKSLRKNFSALSFTVGIRRVDHKSEDDYGHWLSHRSIEALVDACRDRCLTCMLSDVERRKCPLRAALDELPISETERNEDSAGCGYEGMFAGGCRGE